VPRLRYASTEHTADIGLVAYGETLKDVFANAAYGMFDLMVDVSRTPETQRVDVRAEADDTPSLLVAFLNELLFIFETRSVVLVRFEIVEWDETTRLVARAWGSALAGQQPREQIKAATYHDMRVEKTADGYEAEVLFDV
jgi:SHS2 domain-containing protein